MYVAEINQAQFICGTRNLRAYLRIFFFRISASDSPDRVCYFFPPERNFYLLSDINHWLCLRIYTDDG